MARPAPARIAVVVLVEELDQHALMLKIEQRMARQAIRRTSPITEKM
jgi:hypothetical protein